MMSVDTGATLAVTQPRSGTVISANSVPFDVRVSHVKLDCRFAGTPNRAGVGRHRENANSSLLGRSVEIG